MSDVSDLVEVVQQILRDDPRTAIILTEILGPPPGLDAAPSKPWE